MTSTPRVAKLRDSRKAAGLAEVRGIWAPPDQHARIKEHAACLPPLTDDMLRYAMAAMGTGSPSKAQEFRLFWRFASEAYATPPTTKWKA